MPNIYIDRNTFKSRQGITSSADDADILALLEGYSRAIDEYCNRNFHTQAEARYYDGASLTLFLDRDLSAVVSLKTDDNGDGVYETTWATTDYLLLPASGYPKTAILVDRRSSGSKQSLALGVQRGIEVTAKWAYLETLVAPATGNLNEDVDTSETGIDVVNGADFKAGQTIIIESEQMYITGVAANTLTVIRAVNGTIAATHSAVPIYIYQYPLAIQEALFLIASQAWNRRKMAVQGPTVTGRPAAPFAGVTPEARPLLQPFRRIAFAGV